MRSSPPDDDGQDEAGVTPRDLAKSARVGEGSTKLHAGSPRRARKMTREETSRRQEGRRGREVEKARRRREEARKVSSLGLAVSRRLAIPRCDIRAEKVAVSFRTLKYIREETEETGKLCESERRSRRFLGARDIP